MSEKKTSTKKTTAKKKTEQQTEIYYEREELLKSKRYRHVQKDFLGAILNQEKYTLEEADEAVSSFFGGEK